MSRIAQWGMLGLAGVLTLILAGLMVSGACATSADLPKIALDRALHFTDSEGREVLVPAGTYRIEETGESLLKLIPVEGKSSPVIQAIPTSHEGKLSAPVALSLPCGKLDHHLILLLPDGKSLHAVGSSSAARM